MGSTVVRYTTRAERADDNQALIEKVFADLAERRPNGLRYASYRLEDGVTFVHVAQTEQGNPLLDVPAFKEFLRDLGDRVVSGPDATPATLVGSYP